MKTTRSSIHRAANADTQIDVFRAYLAEDYDGIGQFVAVSMNRSAISSAARARVGDGDHGTQGRTPRGTRIVVRSHRGQLEIIAGLGSSKYIITEITAASVGIDEPDKFIQPQGIDSAEAFGSHQVG